MKLYIADESRLNKYILYATNEEYSFLHYKIMNSKNDYPITIVNKNNEYYLQSNGSVNIEQSGKQDFIQKLNEYSSYCLKILGKKENVKVFCLPNVDEQTYKLNIENISEITIGSNNNNTIIYKESNFALQECILKKSNNSWEIQKNTSSNYLYVNNIAVTYKKLKYGDVIFINGLKIIFMPKFIEVNNPANLVNVQNLSIYQEYESNITEYKPVTDEEANVQLYNEEDYFYHVPRMQEVIEIKNITIDAPPNNQSMENVPFFLTIGTSLVMTASSVITGYSIYNSVVNNGAKFISVLPQFIMVLSMLIGSLLIPILSKKWHKKKSKERELLRQKKYGEYLTKKEAEIKLEMNNQKHILLANYPSALECRALINQGKKNIWKREIDDKEFLNVRLGLGNIKPFLNISSPQEKFSLDEDNLMKEVYRINMETKLLDKVPITYSFKDNILSSLIYNTQKNDRYIDGIITQLVTFHSPIDLKLVIFTNEDNANKWNYAKYLPHIWNNEKDTRFFSTNTEELKVVSSYLENEFKERKNKINSRNLSSEEMELINKKEPYKNFRSYYLIITDDYLSVKNTGIIEEIIKNKANYGFSLLTISNSIKNIPKECEKFIDLSESDGCIFEKEVSASKQIKFLLEDINNEDMYDISQKLSIIPIDIKNETAILPKSLSFLDMYDVTYIEQLNISNNWKLNNAIQSLAVPIGVHVNGEKFYLDLHEKYHGPHGLIAGSTGSGKSEFIISFILSMAINYHPYEVQFVLIDYKGGGLAGAFENKEAGIKLPHLVGTITNLDVTEMNRTLVSINSELKRRQKLFNEVKKQLGEGTIDIYKYQKYYREGLVKEPLAHLFVISDEFAELKSQQPEFMQELISTARIGRSLGIHLILATQKPSGVVNDQIWSNSKFKICLKVQDRSDSMEMLKKPDAASIKDVGRFYLQVGYDDYFDIGQSAWSGARYKPTEKIIKKVDDSISFIDNVGYVIKNITDKVSSETSKDIGDQLTNIVKYICKIGTKENIHTNQLWLESLPETLYISNLKQKYNYLPNSYNFTPIIGEYDKPKRQEQGLLNLNLNCQNTIIWGESGSGKDNLLTTIIWSSITEHTPEEINFYIIDCGSEVLQVFNQIPHIGEVTTLESSEKIIGIFNMLQEEIERRKDLLNAYAGSYKAYNESSGKKLPLLVCVISNYENFTDTYNRLSEDILPLYRDGSKYGIVFIITSVSTTGIRARMLQNFSNRITLRLSDDTNYRALLNAPRGLIPKKCFGRGLINLNEDILEFQTAFVYTQKDIYSVIRNSVSLFKQNYKVRAKKISVIPKVVTIDTVIDEIKEVDKIPVGYDLQTKETKTYNFISEPITIISAADMSDKNGFIGAIIKELEMFDICLKIIDVNGILKEYLQPDVNYFDNVNMGIMDIFNEINNYNIQKEKIYIINGISNIHRYLDSTTQLSFYNLIEQLDKFKNVHFIFIDNYLSFKNMELQKWFKNISKGFNGIWLGENFGVQSLFNVMSVSLEVRKLDFPYIGFVINNGNFKVIKSLILERKENNHE